MQNSLCIILSKHLYINVIDKHYISKLIKGTSKVLLVISLIFILGRISRISEIESINIEKRKLENMVSSYEVLNKLYEKNIYKRNKTIDSLHQIFLNRDWLEHIIKKEAGINIPHYLHDSILFTMEKYRFEYHIPNSIYWRLIDKESKFRFVVNPTSGATGYLQVMPSTFKMCLKELDIDPNICRYNREMNIRVGAYYLSKSYNKFSNMGFGDKRVWELTLSEYNAGIKPVMEAGYHIPQYPETIDYVRYILNNYTTK